VEAAQNLSDNSLQAKNRILENLLEKDSEKDLVDNLTREIDNITESISNKPSKKIVLRLKQMESKHDPNRL